MFKYYVLYNGICHISLIAYKSHSDMIIFIILFLPFFLLVKHNI